MNLPTRIHPKATRIPKDIVFRLAVILLFAKCLFASPVLPENMQDLMVPLSSQTTIEFVWIPELKLWAGKYEITLEQYMCLSEHAKHNPREFSDVYFKEMDSMHCPAVMISWQNAHDACTYLNSHHGNSLPSGYMFRLPTETEWESLARCGDDRVYPWGNEWPPQVMSDGVMPNLRGMDPGAMQGVPVIDAYLDGWPSIAPVEVSGANAWGIFGLAGNAQEWCEGWYDKSRKLRLLKGCDAFSFQAKSCEISMRTAKPGHGPIAGYFLWGSKRNQGHIYSGFRIVIAPITTEFHAPKKKAPAP